MVKVIDIDFSNPEHCRALVDLMNHYMTDAMGDHQPHDDKSAQKLVSGLRDQCNKICLLAQIEGQFVGLVNSFINFGTFAAKPFINIHDVVVLDSYRGKGIGRKMLEEVIRRSKEIDCAKITLEVRKDNPRAQYLYKSLGFEDGKPPMLFWSKYL